MTVHQFVKAKITTLDMKYIKRNGAEIDFECYTENPLDLVNLGMFISTAYHKFQQRQAATV